MDCTLRKWRVEDAADLVSAISNRKVQDNLRDGIPYPYSLHDARAFIESVLSADPQQRYAFAIVADGRTVGSIAVTRGSNVHSRTGELGYYLSEAYWNRGIGSRAVRLMVEFIFANTDILRIYAEPFAHNAASCRVLEKAGFRLEGILRKNAVKNGEVLDMKMYAIVREPQLSS